MTSDLEKYSEQLRQLVDDYYRQQMTLFEYRSARKILFDSIERESGESGESDYDMRKPADSK